MTDITDEAEAEAERRELRIYDAFRIERDGDKFMSVEEFLLAYDYFKAGYEAGAELARQDGYKRGFEMGQRSVREPARVTFRDASRYRWLRENSYVEVRCDSPRESGWHPSKLDEAIDRARGSDK